MREGASAEGAAPGLRTPPAVSLLYILKKNKKYNNKGRGSRARHCPGPCPRHDPCQWSGVTHAIREGEMGMPAHLLARPRQPPLAVISPSGKGFRTHHVFHFPIFTISLGAVPATSRRLPNVKKPLTPRRCKGLFKRAARQRGFRPLKAATPIIMAEAAAIRISTSSPAQSPRFRSRKPIRGSRHRVRVQWRFPAPPSARGAPTLARALRCDKLNLRAFL